MRKILLFLFIVICIGVLASIVFDLSNLYKICKPLVIISLAGYYYWSTNSENRSNVVLAALMFSLAGDVLLMFPNHFITGLIAFLLSHILYIVAYRQHQGERRENSLSGIHRIRLAFPVLLLASGLVVILYPRLGDLKIPVIIYTIVLSLMVLNALFRFARTTTESFWLVFSGAVLFMISDSILAINKFLVPERHESLLIMSTYMSAQFLIIQGLIKHKETD